MKQLLVLLGFLAMFAEFALAQTGTIYTVSPDGGGAKANGYFTLKVVNQDGSPFQVILDDRFAGTGPINTLTVREPVYPYNTVLAVHGTHEFPTQTAHTPFYGEATFVSDDGTVVGEFQVYAYYVSVCSGRGCGGTLGWHYRVLIGSTVIVK